MSSNAPINWEIMLRPAATPWPLVGGDFSNDYLWQRYKEQLVELRRQTLPPEGQASVGSDPIVCGYGWFDKTMATATARTPGGKASIRQRVATVITRLKELAVSSPAGQQEVKDMLNILSRDYSTYCPDQTIVGLAWIEDELRVAAVGRGVHHADHSELCLRLMPLLVQSYKSLMIKGKLCSSGDEVVEVYLYQLLRLRFAVGCDTAAQSMLYGWIGESRAGKYANDLELVLRELADKNGLLAFLKTSTRLTAEIMRTEEFKCEFYDPDARAEAPTSRDSCFERKIDAVLARRSMTRAAYDELGVVDPVRLEVEKEANRDLDEGTDAFINRTIEMMMESAGYTVPARV